VHQFMHAALATPLAAAAAAAATSALHKEACASLGVMCLAGPCCSSRTLLLLLLLQVHYARSMQHAASWALTPIMLACCLPLLLQVHYAWWRAQP
jgi:hypothetical protein